MIEFEEDWLASVVFKWRGSVAPRALWYAVPATCLAVLLLLLDDLVPGAREDAGLDVVASSVLWSSATACVVFLVGFRSRQALGRFWEGTGLLHQMRGEWFDAASCLMTFSRGARAAKGDEVDEFRHAFVRLMSLMHGSALEEIKENSKESYEVIDIRGLDPRTRSYLRECKDKHGFNRVEVLLHMVQVLVTQNLDDGVLKIAPPILSRVYQTLSRGLVNLLDAKKITVTRFPFPYVQTVTILLFFYALLTPVVIAAIVQHKAWAALFTFMPVFGLFSINFVAIELESPFGDDANDLPLEHFQKEMNNSLLMLLSEEADHLVHTSTEAAKDIGDLSASLTRSFTSTLDTRGANFERCNTGLQTPAAADSTDTPDLARSIEAHDVCVEEVGRATSDPSDYMGLEAILSGKVMDGMRVAGMLAIPRDDGPPTEQPRNSNTLSTRSPGSSTLSTSSPERGVSEQVAEQIVFNERVPQDYDRRLAQWRDDLDRNAESLKILEAALPQPTGWAAQPLSSEALNAAEITAREELAVEVLDAALPKPPTGPVDAVRALSDSGSGLLNPGAPDTRVHC